VYRSDGQLVAQLTNRVGNVDVLAWSPEGRILAGANSLWRVQGGAMTPAGMLGAGKVGGRVNDVAWSPDGHVLAWAVANSHDVSLASSMGELLVDLGAGSEEVRRVAWDPKAAILAAGGTDGIVRIWDLQQWETRVAALG
jgi:WD40 repeat protein